MGVLDVWLLLYIPFQVYIRKHFQLHFEFSGKEVIVLPLASIASLFVDELMSRQPLNGCM